jgi:hypothetical protein
VVVTSEGVIEAGDAGGAAPAIKTPVIKAPTSRTPASKAAVIKVEDDLDETYDDPYLDEVESDDSDADDDEGAARSRRGSRPRKRGPLAAPSPRRRRLY